MISFWVVVICSFHKLVFPSWSFAEEAVIVVCEFKFVGVESESDVYLRAGLRFRSCTCLSLCIIDLSSSLARCLWEFAVLKLWCIFPLFACSSCGVFIGSWLRVPKSIKGFCCGGIRWVCCSRGWVCISAWVDLWCFVMFSYWPWYWRAFGLVSL